MIKLVPEAATQDQTLAGAMVVILVGACFFTFGYLSRKASPASAGLCMVVGAVAVVIGVVAAWTVAG